MSLKSQTNDFKESIESQKGGTKKSIKADAVENKRF